MKSIAVVVGIVLGSVVGVASQLVPPAPPVKAQEPVVLVPPPAPAAGKSLAEREVMAQDAVASAAAAQASAQMLQGNIPLEQFWQIGPNGQNVILPAPQNPGPRTRAPWYHYHYVFHYDGTYHVEPTLDINGNPIPIVWPQ